MMKRTLAAGLSALLACAAPVMGQDDADRAYRSATGLLSRGMNELAAEEYTAFLKAHASDRRAPTARYGLAVCLSRMGKHAEACEQLKQVVSIPDFEFAADALLLLGQGQIMTDRAPDAVATLTRFVKEHASHKQADAAMCLLGEAQMRAGETEEAVKTFSLLAKRWPESASRERADLLWSICDSTAGRVKEAAARLATLRERLPASARSGQATLLEAQCRHRLGETERAMELYRAVSEGPEAVLQADATLGIAQLTRAAGKPKEARRSIERLLSAEMPKATEPAARLELARCMLDEGETEAALAELERASKGAPEALLDDVAYWSARCESRRGDYAAAARRLEACEAQFARSELLAEMMFERADALARAGKSDDADVALAAFRNRFPEHPLAADAILTRAAAAYQAGDDATAQRLSEEFLRQNPGHARAATAELIVAECRYRARDFGEAERAYARFVERYPEDSNAWHAIVRRGLCLSRLGEQDEAAKVLAPAVSDARGGDPSLRRAAMVALGDAAFARSDWKVAETWFAAIAADTNIGPDDAEVLQDALLKLGLSVHRQGRAEEALRVYDRLAKEYTDGKHRVQGAFERGQALLDLKRDAEAAACFEQVVDAERDAGEPKFTAYCKRHLAGIASRQGRAEDAARLLGEAAEGAGDPVAGRLRLDQGLVLLAAGKYAEAESALRRAAEDGGDIGAEAEANIGIAVARQGRLEEALGLLEKSLSGPTSAGNAARQSLAYERASVLRQMGRDADALRAYEEFLATSPSPRLAAHAAIESAQLHAKAERFAECLSAVEQAQRSAASADEATRAALGDHAAYLRGLCELRLGRSAQAAKTLAAFLKDYPESSLRPAASLVCGEAMLKSNQAGEAARLFQQVAREAKEPALAAPALLRLGEACAAMQNWTGSEQAFAEFLSKFPDSPVWFQAKFGIGWARENQARYDAAMEAYREVAGKHDGPTAARAQFQVGECLFAMKKYDDAVKELLRVDILYAYPEWSAAALYEAGRCLREQTKFAQARAQFQQVIERFPETEWARLARELMDETKPAALPGRDAPTPRASRTTERK